MCRRVLLSFFWDCSTSSSFLCLSMFCLSVSHQFRHFLVSCLPPFSLKRTRSSHIGMRGRSKISRRFPFLSLFTGGEKRKSVTIISVSFVLSCLLPNQSKRNHRAFMLCMCERFLNPFLCNSSIRDGKSLKKQWDKAKENDNDEDAQPKHNQNRREHRVKASARFDWFGSRQEKRSRHGNDSHWFPFSPPVNKERKGKRLDILDRPRIPMCEFLVRFRENRGKQETRKWRNWWETEKQNIERQRKELEVEQAEKNNKRTRQHNDVREEKVTMRARESKKKGGEQSYDRQTNQKKKKRKTKTRKESKRKKERGKRKAEASESKNDFNWRNKNENWSTKHRANHA